MALRLAGDGIHHRMAALLLVAAVVVLGLRLAVLVLPYWCCRARAARSQTYAWEQAAAR